MMNPSLCRLQSQRTNFNKNLKGNCNNPNETSMDWIEFHFLISSWFSHFTKPYILLVTISYSHVLVAIMITKVSFSMRHLKKRVTYLNGRSLFKLPFLFIELNRPFYSLFLIIKFADGIFLCHCGVGMEIIFRTDCLYLIAISLILLGCNISSFISIEIRKVTFSQ